MRSKPSLALAVSLSVLTVGTVAAQDLGPNIHKLKDGIYVYVGKDRPNDAQWMTKNSIPANIDAAYHAVVGRLVFKDN